MSEIRVDTISEKTSANGVAIDSVTLKDGGVTATELASGSTLAIKTNSNTAINIDANGHVTKPLQPCFSVVPTSQQSNVATGAQIAFGTELFDLNGDFASNTFTAPVTGKYFLGHSIRMQEMDSDYTYFLVQITTSNRAYYHIQDTGTYDEDAAYMEWTNGVVADMDAGDTCDLAVAFVGGANQVDISTASFFYGYLIC